jgi:hypothetical protein
MSPFCGQLSDKSQLAFASHMVVRGMKRNRDGTSNADAFLPSSGPLLSNCVIAGRALANSAPRARRQISAASVLAALLAVTRSLDGLFVIPAAA